MFTRLKRHAFSRVSYIYYRLDLQASEGVLRDSSRVAVNEYDQMLAAPAGPTSPRQAASFSERVKSRQEAGSHLYTICLQGDLAHWGWRTDFDASHKLKMVRDVLCVDRPSAILVSFYTETTHRRQGLYEENIRKMLYDAKADGVRDVYIATRVDNGASRRVIERVGFKPFRVYTKSRLLGRTSVRSRAATPED